MVNFRVESKKLKGKSSLGLQSAGMKIKGKCCLNIHLEDILKYQFVSFIFVPYSMFIVITCGKLIHEIKIKNTPNLFSISKL